MAPNHSPKQIAVIFYNPLAGRGKSQTFAREANDYLIARGWMVEQVIATEYAGHAQQQLTPEWAPKVDMIVVVGGDGTLREVASGLPANSKTVLGFIPLGNANVIARELNIPLDPAAAIQVLDSTHVQSMDLGILEADDRPASYFLAMVEMGYGARTVELVDKLRNGSLQWLYRLWGDIIYAIAGVMALNRKTHRPFATHIDKKALPQTAFHGVVGNIKCYAKGWSLTPEADCNNGQLDVMLRTRIDFISTLRTLLASAARRKLPQAIASYNRGSEIIIDADQPLFLQADGDPVKAARHLRLSTVPGAIRIKIIQ